MIELDDFQNIDSIYLFLFFIFDLFITDLRKLKTANMNLKIGREYRIRTCDIDLVRVALYQLS